MGVVRRWIDIERAIRAAVKNGNHRPTELYMDSSFFNSLNLAFALRRTPSRGFSTTSLVGLRGRYRPSNCETLLANLRH